MASKIILDPVDGVIDIDYAIPNKRIREFWVNKETLYNENEGIAKEGWRDKLKYYVKKYDLDSEFLKCTTEHQNY